MKTLTEKQIYHKEWYQRNKKRVKKLAQKWKLQNKEKVKKSQKAWLAFNKERTKGYTQSWTARNPKRCKKNNQTWRKNNKVKHELLSAAWRRDNQFKVCLNQYRRRAKDLGMSFNLTDEYIKSLWTGVCPVFGTQISINVGKGRKDNFLKDRTARASLDRIDSSKGYVQGNVQWISHLANIMKQNANVHQLHQFASWVKGNC